MKGCHTCQPLFATGMSAEQASAIGPLIATVNLLFSWLKTKYGMEWRHDGSRIVLSVVNSVHT